MAKPKWSEKRCGMLAKALAQRERYSCAEIVEFIEEAGEDFPESSSWYSNIAEWAAKRHDVGLYECLRDHGMSVGRLRSELFKSLCNLGREEYLRAHELESISEFLVTMLEDDPSEGTRTSASDYPHATVFVARFMPDRVDLLDVAARAGCPVFKQEAWPAIIDANAIGVAERFAEVGCMPESSVVIGGAVRPAMFDWLVAQGVEIDSAFLSCRREILEKCAASGIPAAEFMGLLNDIDSTVLAAGSGLKHLEEGALEEWLAAGEDFAFRIVGEVLCEYRGDDEVVVVPGGVTRIKGAFDGNQSVKSVTVPEGVTWVGGFKGCSSLERVLLPSTVERVEWSSFEGCDSLEAVDIDERCEKYLSIEGIPAQRSSLATYIELYPGKKCSGGVLEIPEGIGHMPHCLITLPMSEVREIRMPKSLLYFSAWDKYDWKGLEGFHVAEGNESYEFKDGALFERKNARLIACLKSNAGKTYVVPEGTETIGSWAFRNCAEIEEVVLPNSVTSVARYAFSGIGRDVTVKASARLEKVWEYEFDSISGNRGGSFDGFTGAIEYTGKSLPFGPKAFGWSSNVKAALMLPNIPADELPPALRRPAAIGYMMLLARGSSVPVRVAEANAKYIRSHKKDFFTAMCERDEVADYMIEENLIPAKSLPTVIDLAKETGNDALATRLETM